LPAFWWVDGVSAPATAAAASEPAPPPAASAQPVEVADEHPPAALSFEEWLRSMGGGDGTQPEALPVASAEQAEPSLVEEPAAAVLDVRPRVRSVGREKAREHLVAREGSGGIALAMMGTFVAGLLVGALSVRHLRLRRQAEDALDLPPASR
jgi:hypothetical protein